MTRRQRNEAIVAAYLGGKRLALVGDKWGLSPRQIYRILKAAKIDLRGWQNRKRAA